MLFLLNISVVRDRMLNAGLVARPLEDEVLVAEEQSMARDLIQEGVILHIWRVPGKWQNWSIWQEVDATALHARLKQLPLWDYLDITVHPLADHPVTVVEANPPRRTVGNRSMDIEQ